jgi:hypothetical protein
MKGNKMAVFDLGLFTVFVCILFFNNGISINDI